MITVAKFGGSSLANSEQFKKVKDICFSDAKRIAVVVSAVGKSNSSDNKVTDLLYLISAHRRYGVDHSHLTKQVFDKYNEIKTHLKLKINLESEFAKIEEDLKNGASEEYLVSRGEYLSAKMMAEYLQYDFLDSCEVIRFGYDGKVDDDGTKRAILNAFEGGKRLVVPGFYGAYPNGDIKLFTRGGSDITGSLLAKALNADLYENWTDVSGILMADPKVIKNPKRIEEITYDELRELSYMGASVIHEETIFPIQDLNIPICILNTNRPLDKGTIICKNAKDSSQIVTGIAGKKGFVSFTILKNRSTDKLAAIQQVLEVFSHFHVAVEHIPTSIDSFSVVVEKKSVEKCLYDIISELKSLAFVTDVIVDDDVALLAVVGRNMATKSGTSGRIFAIFGKNNINIKMIAQGSVEINIIVGISNKDIEKASRAIYDELIL